jgi:hypothetical protein
VGSNPTSSAGVNMSIKEHVIGQVHFQYYRDRELWYKTDSEFLFPVPIYDSKEIGNATFNRDDKAILFMRYIRKYMNEIESERNPS